jgi:hypothetical protein
MSTTVSVTADGTVTATRDARRAPADPHRRRWRAERPHDRGGSPPLHQPGARQQPDELFTTLTSAMAAAGLEGPGSGHPRMIDRWDA